MSLGTGFSPGATAAMAAQGAGLLALVPAKIREAEEKAIVKTTADTRSRRKSKTAHPSTALAELLIVLCCYVMLCRVAWGAGSDWAEEQRRAPRRAIGKQPNAIE